jgi:hypothetical protein
MGIREPWVQSQSLSVTFLRLSRQTSLRQQIGELVQEGRRAGASAQGRSVEVFGRWLSVLAQRHIAQSFQCRWMIGPKTQALAVGFSRFSELTLVEENPSKACPDFGVRWIQANRLAQGNLCLCALGNAPKDDTQIVVQP